MSVTGEASGAHRSVLIGCAIAAIFWAASGVAALFSPTGFWDPVGSVWFYIIETTHAVAETGMVIALWGLWKGRAWPVRSATTAFVVAIGATALLAFITYLWVILTAAGAPPDVGAELFDAWFVLSVLSTFIGFAWLGIAMIRSRAVHPGVGFLVIAHVLLLAAMAFGPFALGIAIGAVWAAIGWLTTRRSPAL